MGLFTRKKKETVLCPNCRKPVTVGTIFCDSCGLRLTPPPTCGKCQIPLAPETNFCESCGTPVGTAPAQPPQVPAAEECVAAPRKKGRSPRGKRSKKLQQPTGEPAVPPTPAAGGPAPGTRSESPSPGEGAQQEPGGVPSQALPPVPGRAMKFTWPRGTGKTLINGCMIFAGIIIILAFMAGVLHLPSSPTLKLSPVTVASDPHREAPVPETADTTAPPAGLTVTAPSIIPGPTKVPPESLRIWFQAERDPVTNIVSVIFAGGKGQLGVRDILVRLTRFDGQVLTATFRPTTMGEGVSLQGSKYADRLEVIVTYNNGGVYSVIDKVFEYKMRN